MTEQTPTRRRRRLLLWGVCTPAALVVVAFGLLWFWPGAFSGFIASSLQRAFGGEVTIGAVAWDGDELVLDDVHLRAPNLSGPAADILAVHRMRVTLKGSGFSRAIQSVVVEEATLRVAGELGVSEPRLNLNALRHSSATPGGESDATAPSQPPSVKVEDLELIVGTFRGNHFTETGRAHFTVSLEGAEDGRLFGDLVELGLADGLVLQASGNLGSGTGEVRAENLLLDERTEGLIPYPGIRAAVEALDIAGEIPLFTLAMSESLPVSAEMVLDDLTLRLDEDWLGLHEGQGFWATFQDAHVGPAGEAPVMEVDGGRIEFSGDRLLVSGLRGTLIGPGSVDVDIPWSVDLELGELLTTAAASENLDEAIARMPFRLRLSADGFTLTQGQPAVLPRRVASIMELFGVQAAQASVLLDAARTQPGGPVDLGGTLTIADARGAYERFAYPMQELDATIDFDLDTVYVRSATAHGDGGSMIDIEGMVEAANGNEIDLNLHATNVPVDAQLLKALPGVVAQALRDVLPASSEVFASTAGVAAETFDRMDLDLHIGRTGGGPVDISGRIDFEQLELEWHAFPWPIIVSKGWLDWSDGHLRVRSDSGTDALFHTPDGIEGRLVVDIDLPPLEVKKADVRMEASVQLDVQGQPMTGALRDAVSVLTAEGGELLQRTSLAGVMDLDADIHIRFPERSTFDVRIDLHNGRAALSGLGAADGVSMAALLGGTHASIEGALVVKRDSITLDRMQLWNEDARLLLDGDRPGHGTVYLQGESLHLGDWVAELLGEQDRLAGAEVAHRWQPRGRFDLEGTLAEDGLRALVQNLRVDLFGFRPQVTMVQEGGSLLLFPGGLAFEQIDMQVELGGVDYGVFTFDGDIGSGPEGLGALSISGQDVRLGSPLVGDVVQALAGADIGALWNELEPSGLVQLDASVTSETWAVHVQPQTLAFSRAGRRVAAQVEHGRVHLNNQGMEVRDLELRSPGQGRGHLDGAATWAEALVQGRFEFEGSLGGALTGALGGRGFGEVLDAVGYVAGSGDRVSNGRIDLRYLDAGTTGSINADLLLDDAAMDPGLELEHVDARGQLRIAFDGAEPVVLTLDILEADADVGPLRAKRLAGVITTDGDGVVHIHELVGGLSGGRVVVEGDVDPSTDTWSIEVLVSGARLEQMNQKTDGGSDVASGRVESSLRMAGAWGDAVSRRGTGRLRIVEGDLGPLPVAVSLQQLLHLSSPLVSEVDYVQVDYHIDGDRILLDDVVLEASSGSIAAFSMVGSGELFWPAFEVDLRLKPRGGWPLLSDIIGLVQDQLYEIRVRGSLLDPVVDLVPLPGLSASK